MEKKLIVCVGTGRERLVVDIVEEISSCLALEEHDEVADEELDVDEEEVVRFFLPLVEFE